MKFLCWLFGHKPVRECVSACTPIIYETRCGWCAVLIKRESNE